LRHEVPKDFFSEKRFFSKFSKSLKIQFFCNVKHFFPFAKLETSPHFFNQRKIPLHGAAWLSHGAAWLSYGAAWLSYCAAWLSYGAAWLSYGAAWLSW
jgi:hypothetical protein